MSIEDALVREVLQSINVASSGETADRAERIETPFLQLVMTRLWDEEMKAGSSVLRPIAPPPDQPSATRYEIFHDVLAPATQDSPDTREL